ncbi:HAD family hydrolase [Deinococcus maricopensis]|uniref:HAD-superfamily hydrolase, subfamily IA, variant 3 n=1 Tax=Deinococcus maricopensis (strain DSM 21211 / LMG 22137 / NRRL B-23946 / LB-34) TaxID=709986 RepID=E8U8W3_DEIML|nr:HAD family phosphatase [Deinococcus maricopensis]ADV67502.1 HAD-superfamily hydrolase, subfamily IA, variant 3 [Deinococcus maricopensis DSM 21211]
MTIQAVLFDRDNTIAFTDPQVYREVAAYAHATYGVDPRAALEALSSEWQASENAWWDLRSHEDEAAFWTAYAGRLAGRMGTPDVTALLERYPYHAYLKPAPHVREVLEALRAQGVKIGVLSNTLPSVAASLETLGVRDLVDVPLATCLLGVHKPEAQAFTLSADALGVPPAEILFVDDLPENIEGARAAGLRAQLIDLTGERAGAMHDLRALLPLVQAG